MRRVTRFVFSVRIYLSPSGYDLMKWEREFKSSLKLWDLSQKPNVNFWHNFIIYFELFWGKTSNFAKNFEKLTEARHFSKKWSSLSVSISFSKPLCMKFYTLSLILTMNFPEVASFSFFYHFSSSIILLLPSTSISSSLLCFLII